MQEMSGAQVGSLGREDLLEEGDLLVMAWSKIGGWGELNKPIQILAGREQDKVCYLIGYMEFQPKD